MLFSIIIVNYNSQNFLEKCLVSIQKKIISQKLISKIEVLVVNNDKKNIELKKRFKLNLKIIENDTNLGFGRACNVGAQKAKGEILFFLNPDTQLQQSSFKDIYQMFTKNSKLAIIGVNMIDFKSKKTQPWINGKKTSLLKILLKKLTKKYWNSLKPLYLDWVSGGGMFVKKSLFEKINGFDEKFFMYFEDQDFCLRLKDQGFLCLFYPNFKIIHHNGKSWKNNFQNQKSAYYQSQKYFFKKHFPKWYYYIFKLLKKTFKK